MAPELNYELGGRDGAPVIAFTGSLGTDLTMWQPQSDRLGERFRTLRYDIRGHGASEVPPGPYSMDDLGSDLIALLDRLGVERASLCGLSIGGMIGMWVATHAPERVERLVLCCTSAQLGPPETWTERAAAVRAGGVEAVADAVLARWFTSGFAAAEPAVIERMRRILTATPAEGYAGCCEAIAEMDLTRELPAITAPTLVVAGEEDPATPPEHGRRIAELIPAARFEAVSPAAHLATVERPDLTTAMILRFLSDEEA
ncbi:MAG: 3-oxoadipate enol-lactonase [Solirubrobacterales bacterium]|nr:3-oxoadipate enol-lactonase [Solirubrobacterales bacterium]MBV9944653.1 3-oxoadipate enol-lactonase [Solirubrobacterales bacterium]